ncbi:hypothetical protein NH340_JMT08929 [Sarcoptes scabiei]|uniref:Cystatin domain-containing protein n=1 Tax=Sarcoptes scabiei TaxID=52283 RepID=A0A132AF08_SARSC|nr:hypothetical protein QR98_0080540 [Sarcoptes scabiei]UXI22986.1 hypothetical protein NH340_JMT08929 [Sarcoptes scabiei]
MNFFGFCFVLFVMHLESIQTKPIDENRMETVYNPFLFTEVEVAENLNTDDPFLWQMASYVARQMSEKQIKFKLIDLTSAMKKDSKYRLRLTLQRIDQNENTLKKNKILYCTAEVTDDGEAWELDGFGCTLPAIVRVRTSSTSSSSAQSSDPNDSVVETVEGNPIPSDKNDVDENERIENEKDQTESIEVIDDKREQGDDESGRNQNVKTNEILHNIEPKRSSPSQSSTQYLQQPQTMRTNHFFNEYNHLLNRYYQQQMRLQQLYLQQSNIDSRNQHYYQQPRYTYQEHRPLYSFYY